ncbi:MAG TPA: primosomal protein N' [Elusimicrobia bacterium]|nr:MAG: primosomal protein N' [Elusimicrobia bacterium GWD2_63_28]HCC49307.1 primosomal protein N' [Elusimicrobiota bacterium]
MLAEISFPIPLRRTFYYLLPDELELSAAPGLRAVAPLGKRPAATGVILRVLPEKDADLSKFKELKSVTRLLDDEPLFPEDALALSAWMSARWGSPQGLCLGAFYAHAPEDLPAPAALPQPGLASPPGELPELKKFLETLAAQRGGAYLLRLAPLERREAVYPAVFHAALKEPGAQGLLLVPDLSFIPALQAALEPLFPGRVGAWHARLTPKKRAEAWAGARCGRFKVTIATRTGIFLPFKDLSLALLDGEHEEVYRQEEGEPYYQVREVLLRRMAALPGRAVLASPCPSIEAWGAAAAGDLKRFDAVPPARLAGPGPDVRVLDMTQYPGDILARPLADSIRRAVGAGGQALVIAGRKGYASRLLCANCGWMPRCAECGPGLTLLKTAAADPVLLCRRCGKKEPKPAICPACGGRVFRDYGAGTQKTQEALSKLLPGTRIARFDGDVLRGSLKAMREELESFSKGEADVLVGTRIALRELGAPRLTLAAFIDADSDLSSADFRASEKAYRAFYGAWRLLGARGELFIQTREAGHYVFSRLTEMDYPSFADGELAARKDFFYPPFSHIVKARFASYDARAVQAAGADFLKALSFLGRPNCAGEILGPVIPQGQEKKKFYSEYFLVKAAEEKTAALCLARAQALPQRPGVKYFIEADPHGFQ